jgi:uncharacterized protein (TIGR00661 family)
VARIVYSCCGEGRGHSSRTLTLSRALIRLGHEVMLLASGQAYPYLRQCLPNVHSIPGLFIAYADNRVSIRRTLHGNLKILSRKAAITESVMRLIEPFQPDFGIVDFEPFLPLAARRLGVPYISLDHQHVIPHLKLRVAPALWPEYWMTRAVVRLTHSGERANLVTSFFHPPRPHPPRTHFLPPVLREEVLQQPRVNAGHVVVYQTSASFGRLPEILRELPFEFHIYAFEKTGREGNLVFKPRATASFIEDVARADWVLSNGGYTLISEALYLGKPVFSVPVEGQFEQWINAHYLHQLGYGRMCRTRDFGPGALREFVERRGEFRANLQREDFHGNDLILAQVLKYLRELAPGPGAPAPAPAIGQRS